MLKLLIFLKRLATAFFVNFIWKPGRVILRFIFYKVIVKLYKLYLWLLRKLGWSKFKESSLLSIIRRKLAHVIMILVVIIFVFSNLTTKTRADFLAEAAGQTILASLVKSEFDSPEEGQLVEEFFDEEAVISSAQQSYLENLSAVKAEPVAPGGSSGEEEIEGLGATTQGGSVLVKPDIAATKKAKRPRKEIINYIVKAGDTISTIADEFAVGVSTILWENNLSAYSIIRPGDTLAILPVSGVTHKVASGENLSVLAKKYNVPAENILEANRFSDSSQLAIGQKLIIPGGGKIAYAEAKPSNYSGFNVIKDIVEQDLLKPVNAKSLAGNKMNWPTLGKRITQYFSWRHRALDIANKLGTPIYAADTGIVEYAGWGKGYGIQIVVDHGGGKKTRYAHLSKLYIKKGDEVEKGEAIGAMGSTGRSTGSHLHFEVIINGAKYNPFNYTR